MASQMLNDATFAPGSLTLRRESSATPTMTLRGTIFKSLLLLLVAIVFGAFGWNGRSTGSPPHRVSGG